MISEVVIPDLGATEEEIKVVEWLVDVGSFIKAGAPMFVVETDKATVEVEAFRDGYVRKILVPNDTTAEIGTAVAILADSMEEPLDVSPVRQPAKQAVESGALPPARSGHPGRAEPAASGRVLASPLVRRFAEEHKIALATVAGSGPEGKIRKEDVLAALQERRAPGGTPAASPPARTEPFEGGVRHIPVTPMRKAIGHRTQLSKSQAPHYYVAMDIDMAGTNELRKQCADRAQATGRQAPSVTDFVVGAAALALRKTPQLNVSFQGDTIAQFEDIHVGLVIALPAGMIVPVIRHADKKSLYEIAVETRQLRAKAEAGTLSHPEITGSTFTISNLGMFGVDSFISIINPPEAAVLALGAIRLRPTVFEGQVVARPVMTATLSADHRVVDGVMASRFLAEFKRLLENPSELVLERPEKNVG